jgi:hypothetical protein
MPSDMAVRRWRPHIEAMPRSHPHAEATYRVIPVQNGAFEVEVTIPESSPTKVSPFASEAAAEAWIARHQGQVRTQTQSGRWLRSNGRPRNRA